MFKTKTVTEKKVTWVKKEEDVQVEKNVEYGPGYLPIYRDTHTDVWHDNRTGQQKFDGMLYDHNSVGRLGQVYLDQVKWGFRALLYVPPGATVKDTLDAFNNLPTDKIA